MKNSHAIFTSMILKGVSEQKKSLSSEVASLKEIREAMDSSLKNFGQCLQEKIYLLEELIEKKSHQCQQKKGK